MALIFENKVPASYRSAFVQKVKEVCSRLKINPNWLMAIMYFESAGSFSPSKTNSLGYVGLIQFGAAAATELKTTRAALGQMTAVRQLDFVEAYYKIWYKRLKISSPDSYTDCYLITLFPAAVNKGLDFVIQSGAISPQKFAINNPAFDINKDRQVTVKEVRDVMIRQIPSIYVQEFLKKKERP